MRRYTQLIAHRVCSTLIDIQYKCKFSPMTCDVYAGLQGAPIGANLAISLTYLFTHIKRAYNTPQIPSSRALEHKCRTARIALLTDCGRHENSQTDTVRQDDEAVYLVYTLIRPRKGSRYLPGLSWTTHWDMQVRETYYGLRSGPNEPGPAQRSTKVFTLRTESEHDHNARKKDIFKILVGYTHLGDDDIQHIGN